MDYQYYHLRVVGGHSITAQDRTVCGGMWQLLVICILLVVGRRCRESSDLAGRYHPRICGLILLCTEYVREQAVTFCALCLGGRRDLLAGLEGEDSGPDVLHHGRSGPTKLAVSEARSHVTNQQVYVFFKHCQYVQALARKH